MRAFLFALIFFFLGSSKIELLCGQDNDTAMIVLSANEVEESQPKINLEGGQSSLLDIVEDQANLPGISELYNVVENRLAPNFEVRTNDEVIVPYLEIKNHILIQITTFMLLFSNPSSTEKELSDFKVKIDFPNDISIKDRRKLSACLQNINNKLKPFVKHKKNIDKSMVQLFKTFIKMNNELK